MTAAVAGGGRPPRTRVGSLPSEATSFVGRRTEIAEVKRLLSDSRLVTLTGPGGVGKTRLALRVAVNLTRAFHDRVWLAELAELRDPALLANTVAEKLGIPEQAGRPVVETIIESLPSGPVLLVLDNCEHLIDACAGFLDTLLRSCPDLRVLATSRQSLGLLAESVFTVYPLRVPDPQRPRSPEAVTRYSCVRLFVERAVTVRQEFRVDEGNFEAIARVCHDLDGIPLAIELTAVRLRSLPINEIAERLAERYRLLGEGPRAAPARQRTLRALIDWSYNLCSEPERLVWARASVFSGDFDLDAAEYVTSGGEVVADDVLNIVDSLVDKSILLRDEQDGSVRYRLLETVREYGAEKLAATDETTQVRRRHRDWYAQITSQFAAQWHGPDQFWWVRKLCREHANLRVALDFCAGEPGEAHIGMRMATQIDDYWGIRGFHTEARHWLDHTLSATPEGTPERASALRMDGWFALLQGDLERGQTLLIEAAELTERLPYEVERAYVTQAFAMAALFVGDMEQAVTLFSEALAGFRAEGVVRGELFTRYILGLTLGVKGEVERGLAMLDDLLDRTTELGEVFWRSYALWSVAYVEVLHGSLERSATTAKEALRIQRGMENKLAMALTLDTLAWIKERAGQHTRASVVFGAAAAVWHAIGAAPDNFAPFKKPHYDYLSEARHALGDRAFDAAFARGRQMSSDDALDFALDTEQAPEKCSRRDERTPLTPREQQIAELVAAGLTNKEIAARLVIARRTAEGHVEHIMSKLGVHSRAGIAAWIAERHVP